MLIFYEIKENSDLAGDRSKYPVTSPRGVAEERQSQNEEFVGQSQVPDVVVANKILLQTFVVVANGAITYRWIARYDVQYQGVADQSSSV